MTTTLQLSPDLALPPDAVSRVNAFIGQREAGKTYAAQKVGEEMLAAGMQILAYDVVGNWYGLGLNRAGDGAGFPIVVFGGTHADLPLSVPLARTIAGLIVERRLSAEAAATLFRERERCRQQRRRGESKTKEAA